MNNELELLKETLLKEEEELLKALERTRIDLMLLSMPQEVREILKGFNVTFSHVESNISLVKAGELAYIPDASETEILLMCHCGGVCNLIEHTMYDEYDYDYADYDKIFVFKKQ